MGQASKLHIANSLWGDSYDAFEQPFLDALAVDYGAGLRLADFESSPDASRQAVNGWGSAQTSGKIAALIPPGGITPATRFVIADAIYFDAAWSQPFPLGFTSMMPFTRLDGSTVSVPMMYLDDGRFGYTAASGYEAVELRYVGGQVAMDIVLPNLGTSPSALSADTFSGLVNNLSVKSVALSMPKFQTAGATVDLASTLAQLGMPTAFGPGADFSGITKSEPLFLSHVFHQAFLDVTEVGTEAAGATAIVGEATSAHSVDVTLAVNRPFFVAIRDLPTGTILFMGSVVDPSR